MVYGVVLLLLLECILSILFASPLWSCGGDGGDGGDGGVYLIINIYSITSIYLLDCVCNIYTSTAGTIKCCHLYNRAIFLTF